MFVLMKVLVLLILLIATSAYDEVVLCTYVKLLVNSIMVMALVTLPLIVCAFGYLSVVDSSGFWLCPVQLVYEGLISRI